MGLYNFPYTNFHDMNLDWILTKMKELIAEFTALDGNFDSLSDEFTDLKDYINNYFDNLDLTDEVRTVINELITSGYIDTIVSQMVEEGYFRNIVNDIVHNTSARPTQYNEQAVDQFLETVNTYKTNTASLYYNNGTALNVTMNVDSGRYGIDCSTLMLLGLKGVPYSDSRYVNQLTRDDNYSMYPWGIDMYSGRTKTVNGVAEYFRYATDIARWFWNHSLVYKPDTTFSNAKVGDILFWVNAADVDNEDIESTISGVHHCAVFTGLDGSGNITYIDANNNRANVVDDVTVAPSSEPEITFIGAFPALYSPSDDREIRAKTYLGTNLAKSNVNYEAMTFSNIGGNNYSGHLSLTSGKLKVLTPGLYMISAQIKVSNASAYSQWHVVLYDSSDVGQTVAEGAVGAFTDINSNAHNGYANVSLVRYIEKDGSVGLTTAGTSTFMSGLVGTYVEISKL